jgi:general stress protein 26
VWGLWLDDAVWFSTSPQSQKGLNIAHDPRVVIHLESGDDTVIVEGEIEVPTDRAGLERFVESYEKKYAYRPELSDENQGIFVLRPQVAQTWRESDFPQTATRWVFS